MAKKKIVCTVETFAEFEQLVNKIYRDDLEDAHLDVREKKAVARIKEIYGRKKKEVRARRDANMEQAIMYASVHRKELFGDRQSACTDIAKYGFRMGTFEVCPVKGYKEKAALQTLVDMYEEGYNGAREFLSITYKLDKSKICDALKENREHWISEFFQITQTESFKVDPKPEKKVGAA